MTTEERPLTLVIYVYSETDHLKKANMEYFLQHGLCENCTNVENVIILNGPSELQFPVHKNLYILRRANQCGDFGAWSQLFTEMDPEKYKKYKRFMFINDTVRGPFVDPSFYLMSKQDFHFTDIFNLYVTNSTRMIGSYINCGSVWGQGGEGYSHVQTMSFMLDNVALEVIRPLIKCYQDKIDTVTLGEIGMSKALLEANINIGSLLYAYRGVDFRTDSKMRLECNTKLDATIDGNYFGISVNPFEVVFYKNTRISTDMRVVDLYSNSMKKPNFIVRKK